MAIQAQRAYFVYKNKPPYSEGPLIFKASHICDPEYFGLQRNAELFIHITTIETIPKAGISDEL